MNQECKHCGQQLQRLILLALLQDVGCSVFPSATHCSEAQEHEFVKEQP